MGYLVFSDMHLYYNNINSTKEKVLEIKIIKPASKIRLVIT